MRVDLKRLCKKLDYEFNDTKLLKRALTHCSASNDNNERLEFLGDSILSFVIASVLYARFPDSSEGDLSRLRANLVKGDSLAEIAKEINLGDYLILGQGEMKSGGFRRSSILADGLEAVIAAIFLDSGIEQCRKVVLNLYEKRLNNDSAHGNLKDSKTQLQEYLQSKKLALPVYELVGVEGEHHMQNFKVKCIVESLKLETFGEGGSRRKAEQQAAKKFLKQLTG